MTLTHLDKSGRPRLVDVGAKEVTQRTAKASAEVEMSEAALAALLSGGASKGDVLAAAQLAAVMAAKRTSELIPMCHNVPLSAVNIAFENTASGVKIFAEVSAEAKTGVEMEALTAVSAGALTVYDMLKAVDKGMVIKEIKLLEKRGGARGDYKREEKL